MIEVEDGILNKLSWTRQYFLVTLFGYSSGGESWQVGGQTGIEIFVARVDLKFLYSEYLISPSDRFIDLKQRIITHKVLNKFSFELTPRLDILFLPTLHSLSLIL